MERKDYTTLVSTNIPNEEVYSFTFPLNVLYGYNGADNLDETLDDQLLYYITEPLLNNSVEYNFSLDWSAENTSAGSLSIILKVNGEKFNIEMVTENLGKYGMDNGLVLTKIR
ncbi:MAG TPA: hypothetical protein VK174_07280 [Chitinophagales bacterium]|nr:hypothetical protein [Chitinophagales bacterium]